MKRQAINWEKIVANGITDNEPIYRRPLKTQQLENKQPSLKMGKRSESLPKKIYRWQISK